MALKVHAPRPDVVLLDIEGTTSSIEFVYQELFPYVRRELNAYLAAHWEERETEAACEKIAIESGAASREEFAGALLPHQVREKVCAEVFRLMDEDVKSTGLKELQGLVSQAGYESGALRAHFYPDVAPALKRWTAAGVRCCVYSSGSIGAQHNFYRYSQAGDLRPLISAHFDTTSGPKREAGTYGRIAAALHTAAEHIVFLSDVIEELDAARSAGLQTILVIRPGNKPAARAHTQRIAYDFNEAEKLFGV